MVAGTWSAKDALTTAVANMIEARYLGLVQGVEVPFYDSAGMQLGDHDILLSNSVLQIKGGTNTSRLFQQLEASEAAAGLPVLGYAPNLPARAIRGIGLKGGAVTADIDLLLDVLEP